MRPHLHFLPDLALVFGQAGDSGWHAHRALQLACALDGDFELQRAGLPSQSLRFAAIAPQQRHRIRGGGARIAHLFLDCGAHAWTRWRADGGVPAEPDATLLDALRHAHGAPGDACGALARAWRAASLSGLGAAPIGDARIARAVALIDADPTQDALGHRELAGRVHLSASRFAALFRAQTGLPVRNYVLWRRLLCAVQRLEAGLSVTAAAHASGFADAAHLSRSFRQVLGAAPSELAILRHADGEAAHPSAARRSII